MSLKEYHRKRDFTRTKEPAGKKGGKQAKARRFVIQKHDASRLHFDFRLEFGGSLKSWAVPKGIPMKKGEKHLAVQVEDHPLGYGDFEGTIPKGQYGGGTVMLWDHGTFTPVETAPVKALQKGKLHFVLKGEKLSGEWALVRMHREEKEWLLIKMGDNCTLRKSAAEKSVASGRTMKQIAAGKAPTTKQVTKLAKKHVRNRTPPKPMKATLHAEPPMDEGWEYELKFDGYRALAVVEDGDVQLFSSNGHMFDYPGIAEALQSLKIHQAVLDGELVVLDEEGKSSFQLMQNASGDVLHYYLFDLLEKECKNYRSQTLHERRAALKKLLHGARAPLHFSTTLQGKGDEVLAAACRLGLEGVIGKREDSSYEEGRRSPAWIKLKCVNEQEFVIGGFTDPEGARKHFGALLVGYYQGKKLHFAGKVGTGFSHGILQSLSRKMSVHSRKSCPFDNVPERTQGRWHQNITQAEMKRCHWIDPVLVAQVRFTEWTQEGKLRHPVYLGLREDKEAREVVRERRKRS